MKSQIHFKWSVCVSINTRQSLRLICGISSKENTSWGQSTATTQLLHPTISQSNLQSNPLQGRCFGERGVNPSPCEQADLKYSPKLSPPWTRTPCCLLWGVRLSCSKSGFNSVYGSQGSRPAPRQVPVPTTLPSVLQLSKLLAKCHATYKG